MSDLETFLETIIAYANLEQVAEHQQSARGIEQLAEQLTAVAAATSSELLAKIVTELTQPDVVGCINDVSKSETLKQSANKLFAAKEYNKAVASYSEALGYLTPRAHASLCSVLYCNRALALTKLEDYQGALLDSTDAISLNSSSAKAYFIKAQAQLALGRHDGAQRDAQRALELLQEQGGSTTQVETLLASLSTGGGSESQEKGVRHEAWTTHHMPWQLQGDDEQIDATKADGIGRNSTSGCTLEELDGLVAQVASKRVAVEMHGVEGRRLVVQESIEAGTDLFTDDPVAHAQSKTARKRVSAGI